MARSLRVEFEGAVYHVTARGIERGRIFESDHDRQVFLEKLKDSVGLYHIRLYAYVLMDNHFHLILCTPRANLSPFMQQFNSSYTMYFNTIHQRVGHLFAGRYKAKPVDGDAYLMKLSRYVHLNPVKTVAASKWPLEEKIRFLRSFAWSSFPAYAGFIPKLSWVNYDALDAQVGSVLGTGVKRYQNYVETGLAEDDVEFRQMLNRSTKAIGGVDFQRAMERVYKEKANGSIDVSMRRVEVGVPLDQAMKIVAEELGFSSGTRTLAGMDNGETGVILTFLKQYTGLSQRELAKRLLNHSDGSAASRYMKTARQAMKDRPGLEALFSKLEQRVQML
jgi:REP element-mobilizing transposase RayT